MAQRQKQKIKASPGLRQIRKTKGLSAKIARAAGISRQAVTDWQVVPLGRLLIVERLSGIPRERLRPDIFRRR